MAPLAGLTVVEFPAIGPVPFAGQQLRGLGARVIRLVRPGGHDLGVHIPEEAHGLNDGKDPVAVDLKADPTTAHALVATADVVLEGFRPGVMERLGFGPEVLCTRHPKLIYGRVSGWPRHGPRALEAGHDITYLAATGVLAAIGPAERPVPPLNLIGDFGGAAMMLVRDVLAALVARGVTGQGAVVETSIYEATVALADPLARLQAAGLWSTQREDNLLDGGAPFYRCYRAACGTWLAVGAIERRFWQALLTVLDLTADVDATDQHTRSTWPATIARLDARFAEQPATHWLTLAAGTDACLERVRVGMVR
ncbi:MAG: CaiB/BaiF CoA-transferase family protein [Alphaproteobacteria bacterium]|nr:CaiB/BaiF CoA-transferase family protein [Alphaproteobacteria bacterium]